jgi:hypothetical protein
MDQQLGALAEVIDHYRSSGVLRTVDGLQGIAGVAEAIDATLDGVGIRAAGALKEPSVG